MGAILDRLGLVMAGRLINRCERYIDPLGLGAS
jgi:hypothetical protein